MTYMLIILYVLSFLFFANVRFRAVGGCEALHAAFKHVKICPLDASLPEFQSAGENADKAVLAYKRFEEALDVLPGATAIVCKSATRASAVLAANKVYYLFVNLVGCISRKLYCT